MALLLYTATLVPFKIAFMQTDELGVEIFEATVDALFAIDIFVNFISATEDGGGILLDRK